jgi:hypothetical protein
MKVDERRAAARLERAHDLERRLLLARRERSLSPVAVALEAQAQATAGRMKAKG